MMYKIHMNPSFVLRKLRNRQKAKALAWFFKTKKGQYGYGDMFLGVTVPDIRRLVREYQHTSWNHIDTLITSKFHEERLMALLLLVRLFERGTPEQKDIIFTYYKDHVQYINNWDLVDLTAPRIVGEYQSDKKFALIATYIKSPSVWKRRIAVLATFPDISSGHSKEALLVAQTLLGDKHDLIHKAVGWMLREVGKRCSQQEEEEFLKKYYKVMPRTMLRYAIERFDPDTRKQYMLK